jgi:hypothetical protein
MTKYITIEDKIDFKIIVILKSIHNQLKCQSLFPISICMQMFTETL